MICPDDQIGFYLRAVGKFNPATYWFRSVSSQFEDYAVSILADVSVLSLQFVFLSFGAFIFILTTLPILSSVYLDFQTMLFCTNYIS